MTSRRKLNSPSQLSWSVIREFSELEPQCELDLTFPVRRLGNGSGGAGVLGWVRGIEHHIPRDGTVKVRVIEDVENLCSELQIHFFLQRNPLEQRRVQVIEPRSRKPAARHVAEGPGRRQQEGIGIEIPAGFLEPV